MKKTIILSIMFLALASCGAQPENATVQHSSSTWMTTTSTEIHYAENTVSGAIITPAHTVVTGSEVRIPTADISSEIQSSSGIENLN